MTDEERELEERKVKALEESAKEAKKSARDTQEMKEHMEGEEEIIET